MNSKEILLIILAIIAMFDKNVDISLESTTEPTMQHDGIIFYDVDTTGSIRVGHSFNTSVMSAEEGMELIQSHIDSYRPKPVSPHKKRKKKEIRM